MGCFPFANSRFKMGVTVMGFAEHFGLGSPKLYLLTLNSKNSIAALVEKCQFTT